MNELGNRMKTKEREAFVFILKERIEGELGSEGEGDGIRGNKEGGRRERWLRN